LAVTPDGSKVYITIRNSNTVAVIDTATNEVITTIPVGITPRWCGVEPGREQGLRHEQQLSLVQSAKREHRHGKPDDLADRVRHCPADGTRRRSVGVRRVQ
jgi:YVTN family beta-propeller protein